MVFSPRAPTLRSVSDTALLVAYHRAMESRRPDALFRDEAAIRLSAGRGKDIARRIPFGRQMAASTVVRTVLLDDVVTRLVGGGVDTVVNLAAGLDTRPYRLPLPPSLRWVEVDLPDMVREKNEALAGESPRCRVEREPCDLTDAAPRRALLSRLAGESRRLLVVTEGLLIYLAPDTVRELADDLAARPSIRYWAADLATPHVLKWMKRMLGKKFDPAGASFRFAPENGARFFEPHGWREAESYSLFEHSIRLHREMNGMWFFKLMMRVAPGRSARGMEKWQAKVVLLERTG